MIKQQRGSGCCQGCLLCALRFASDLHCFEMLGLILSRITKCSKCFSSWVYSLESPFLSEVSLTTSQGQLCLDFFSMQFQLKLRPAVSPHQSPSDQDENVCTVNVSLFSLWEQMCLALSSLGIRRQNLHLSGERRQTHLPVGIEAKRPAHLQDEVWSIPGRNSHPLLHVDVGWAKHVLSCP